MAVGGPRADVFRGPRQRPPAQTLRIGLAEDPDLLDPTLAETSGACPTGNFAPYDHFKVTRML